MIGNRCPSRRYTNTGCSKLIKATASLGKPEEPRRPACAHVHGGPLWEAARSPQGFDPDVFRIVCLTSVGAATANPMRPIRRRTWRTTRRTPHRRYRSAAPTPEHGPLGALRRFVGIHPDLALPRTAPPANRSCALPSSGCGDRRREPRASGGDDCVHAMLEQELARVPDTAPQDFDTAPEVLDRAVGHSALRADIVALPG